MAVAVPLLIQVGVAAGAHIASGLLAPKPKLNPVDKGRFDDIRFQTAEEGSFTPLCFGQRVRLAGNMIWGTPTFEYVTTTEGRSGGKGGDPQPPTPPTNTFTYKKSFAFLITETPIKSVRRISENLETIYNNVGSSMREGFYEAEDARLGGGAAVFVDGQLSGGRGVRLGGTGNYVEFEVWAEYAGVHTGSLFYKATAGASTVLLSANGGAETNISLPQVTATPSTVSFSLSLRRGLNIVKVRRNTGTPDIDRIYVSGAGLAPPDDFDPRKDRDITNLIDLNATYPTSLDNPTPYYNVVQGFDANGYFEGHLTAGGQARIEIFAGKETQPQSAIIVAREGASKTPAWRDAAYFVAEDYILRGPQLGNIIFEIEPEIQALDAILLYLYLLDGKVTAAQCDFSALAGITPRGFILDHRAPLEDWVTALESWFDFDIVPRGGKITAVKRGGAVVTRLYERELRAHLFGEQRPRAAVKIEHADPSDLPQSVDVIYLDPSPAKDFHTANQTAQKTVGFAFDKETLSFPIVGDPDTAHAVGLKYLDTRHLAKDAGTIVCGFGKRYLIPSDPVEVEMEDGTLHTYRITQKQADLQSMVKFSVVPDRPSIYTQTGHGSRARGGDVIVVRPPANSHLVQADVPPLRTAERGRLGRYMGGCGRAGGSWNGAGLQKETDAGAYVQVTTFDTEARIGKCLTALPNWTNADVDDTTSTLDVGLFNGTLESITDGEFANNSELNVLIVVHADGTGEIVRYKTVTPLAVAAGEPYEFKARLSVFKRGQNNTAHAMTGHTSSDSVMVPDTAVKFVEEPVEEMNRPRKWKLVSAGQAIADAPEVETTLHGYSYLPGPLRQLTGQRNAATQDVFIGWTPFEAGGAREYLLRFYAPGGSTPVREVLHKGGGTDATIWTRDDLLGDGTPVVSAAPGSTAASVGTDGTVSTTGSSLTSARFVSQEIRGDAVAQFMADNRATPVSVMIVGAAPRPCVVDPATDKVKITANDLNIVNGQQVQFRLAGGVGSLPGGVANQDAAYYILNFDGTDTFQVSLLPNGAPLNFTSAGSGVRAHVISGFAQISTEIGAGGEVFIMPESASLLKKRAIPKEAYAIEIASRLGRYFVPYTGDTRQPTFTAGGGVLPDPCRLSVMLGFLNGVAQAAVTPKLSFRRPESFTYTRDMQNTDFASSPPGTVKIEVREVVYIGGKRIEGMVKTITI